MTVNEKSHEQVELQDLGNGHWRAVCGDRSFRTDERDSDLWVDHRELAQFFGYVGKQGPTKLKELLERCRVDGLILPNEVVSKMDTNKFGDVTEHIAIKRKAALALAMRCTLPNAVKLARKMADVFEQWLDRRHVASTEVHGDLVAELREEIRRLHAENAEIRKLIAAGTSPHGLLGREKARELLDEIQRVAELFIPRVLDMNAWLRRRKRIETRVRKAARWPQCGRLEDQPASGEEQAWLRLREYETQARDEAQENRAAHRVKNAAREVHEAAKQMPLRGMN